MVWFKLLLGIKIEPIPSKKPRSTLLKKKTTLPMDKPICPNVSPINIKNISLFVKNKYDCGHDRCDIKFCPVVVNYFENFKNLENKKI